MQVYLIRHGSTPGNLDSRYVGSTDEALTEEAVQALKKDRTRYPKPDMVFTSPLLRCRQTAELLFPEEKQQILSDLRECSFGVFEYKNYKELSGNRQYQEWIDSGGTIPFPGGESREKFSGRCCEAFLQGCRTAEQAGCTSAAFVVHGGTIMAVMERFGLPEKDYYDWHVKNACGYAGEFAAEDFCGQPKLSEICVLPYETGVEAEYVLRRNEKLRCGYTTGSCAAAAAKAAAVMLLSKEKCSSVKLMTPKGILLELPVQSRIIGADDASCAVRKYAGDDPDATDGILIFACVQRVDAVSQQPLLAERTDGSVCVEIDGGTGVGRVTKPGLEQPVGAAAINRIPREMIRRAVEEVCAEYGYQGGMKVIISVPEGEKIAQKTFNPHLGIEGGISILGTKGIVMPMSEEALIASIRLEMKQKYENGARFLLITPGNYGADFISRADRTAVLDASDSMKCSNYVGETVDMAVDLGFQGILFVAHIGKFIKVSGGIMNTHSASADCRAELMAAQTMRVVQRLENARMEMYGAGTDKEGQTLCREAADREGQPQCKENADRKWQPRYTDTADREGQPQYRETVQQILASNTTEEAVGILRRAGLQDEVMEEIIQRVHFHLQKRCAGRIKTEVVLFSNQYGYLAETKGADCLIKYFAGKET